MRFTEALTGYWLDKQLEFSKATIRNYKYVFGVFSRFISDKPLHEITQADIKAYLLYLQTERHNAKYSLQINFLTISSFFKWAETELGCNNPIKGIKKPKHNPKPVQPFSSDEVRQLLSAKQPIRLKLVQHILLDTGMRISELCSLKPDDYDQKLGKLRIRHGKGDKERFVYLGNKTQKLLWKFPKGTKYLIETRNQTPIHRNTYQRDLSILGKKLGIQANPHKYRHTFAVNFLRNGGNIKQLQLLLGHSDLQTVNLYLQLAEQDLEQSRTYSPVDNL